MELKATAKINLGLDVLRKREDGYHDLRMVMQMTGMFDRISMFPRAGRPGISFRTNLPYIPANENNLAYRAAKLLMDEFEVNDGLSINLQKFIPVAAGLAGGSTDAAAVLVGTNKLFHLGLSPEELMVYCLLNRRSAYRRRRFTALSMPMRLRSTRISTGWSRH